MASASATLRARPHARGVFGQAGRFQVRVGVDEARQHGAALEVHAGRPRTGQRANIAIGPYCNELAVPDRQRLHDMEVPVGGDDLAVVEDGICLQRRRYRLRCAIGRFPGQQQSQQAGRCSRPTRAKPHSVPPVTRNFARGEHHSDDKPRTSDALSRSVLHSRRRISSSERPTLIPAPGGLPSGRRFPPLIIVPASEARTASRSSQVKTWLQVP
jgi:hypothetical protein